MNFPLAGYSQYAVNPYAPQKNKLGSAIGLGMDWFQQSQAQPYANMGNVAPTLSPEQNAAYAAVEMTGGLEQPLLVATPNELAATMGAPVEGMNPMQMFNPVLEPMSGEAFNAQRGWFGNTFGRSPLLDTRGNVMRDAFGNIQYSSDPSGMDWLGVGMGLAQAGLGFHQAEEQLNIAQGNLDLARQKRRDALAADKRLDDVYGEMGRTA